ELAAAGTVGANEIRIAEPADGAFPVLEAAGPQVASSKAAEHGGASGLCALALQGAENLLDLIDAHPPSPNAKRAPSRPFSRTPDAEKPSNGGGDPFLQLALGRCPHLRGG